MGRKLAAAGRAGEYLAACVLVALLAWGAKAFTRGDTVISTVWLANGLLLGLVLTASRHRRLPLLAAGLAGNFASGFIAGDTLVATLSIGVLNVFEVWVASARQREVAEARDLTNAVTFRRFLLYAVGLAPLASTLAHVAWVLLTIGHVEWDLTLAWWLSHALGIATFTPVTLALRRDGARGLLHRERLREFLLTLLLVSLVSAVVFWQSTFPLLFLVFPAMLLMAMRCGFGGTAIGVVVVVVLAVTLTVTGHGPLTLSRAGASAQNFLVLQLFIASLLLTMFPVVVVLAERRRAHQDERDTALKLELLAEHSTDVIVLTDAAGKRLYVSPAVQEVLGYTAEEFLQLTWRELAAPDDHERVWQDLQERAQTRGRCTVVYRARRKDGQEIFIEAVVATFHDEDLQRLARSLGVRELDGGADGCEGRVVTLRDVTRRKRMEDALAAANEELASLVWKDSLTGLGNRRRFDEALMEEWGRCLRAGLPLTVIMIDVDWFKAFNDEHGHQQGDYRLIEVARAISNALFRPRDVPVRYGGEEFAVILPATGVDEAGLVAERIRENVAALGVTVSVGVAGAVPLPNGRPQDIVKAADDALYTSKREGRNRTTLLQVGWPADPGF